MYAMKYILLFLCLQLMFLISINAQNHCQQKLEICFLIDATGSMRSVMEDFKTTLPSVLKDVKMDWQDWSTEISAVLYRDQEEEYLTRVFEKTTNLKSFVDFMQKQYAVGGGDELESMPAAFHEAINTIQWQIGKHPKFIITFTDNDIKLTANQFNAGKDLSIQQLLFPIKGREGWIGDTEPISYLSEFINNHINSYISNHHCNFEKEKVTTENVNFSIFPNPTAEEFTVSLPAGKWQLELQTINGNTLKSVEVEGDFSENVKSLPAGTYFIKISSGQFSQTEKLVVVK